MSNKKLLLIAVIMINYTIGIAQQTTTISNNWSYLKSDVGGIWEIVRLYNKSNPENVPAWSPVSLPHCVNALDGVDPDKNYYQGPAWYKSQIKINNPYSGGQTLLYFEGSGQKTDVYIYTTKVASHKGGYDEWNVNITEAVEAFKKTDVFKTQFNEQIPISIRVDNTRDLESIPSQLSDFNIYGGIYRPLHLVYNPKMYFDKLFVKATVDSTLSKGQLEISARIVHPKEIASANIAVVVKNPNGKEIFKDKLSNVSCNGDVLVAKTNIKNPILWHTENPKLYTVEATVINSLDTATISEKVGFRRFEFLTKGPFIFNGKRLLLKGTQIHEDHTNVGAAMTEEMQRTQMIMIKQMGANFIRLGHYQQSKTTLHLCDSLGILAWEEAPWCRGGLGGDGYQIQAKTMLTNMIEQHFNHPSVIIWGLGNENDWPGDFVEFDKEKIRAFMSQMNTIAHILDASRKTAIRRCDFCKDIVDVYSPSIWAGWYRGIFTDYKAFTKLDFDKVKHFFHAEWGGDSHAKRFSEITDNELKKVVDSNTLEIRQNNIEVYKTAIGTTKDGDWNENYICNLFDWHLKEQETMPWLSGSAQWVFKDFATPLRPENPVPYINQKGVVERDFTKKEGYFVFQSYWSKEPMLRIFGHNFTTRWGAENEEKMIKVYSNCLQVELFLNGKSLGVHQRNSQDFPAAGLRWNAAFKKGMNTVVAKALNTTISDTVTFMYQTDVWGKPSYATLEKIATANDTTTVQVKLFDSKGTPCLDATNWVRYSIAGDGQLIENQGTSSGSRYVQMTNGTSIIRIKTNKGKSVVSAAVKGVETVLLTL